MPRTYSLPLPAIVSFLINYCCIYSNERSQTPRSPSLFFCSFQKVRKKEKWQHHVATGVHSCWFFFLSQLLCLLVVYPHKATFRPIGLLASNTAIYCSLPRNPPTLRAWYVFAMRHHTTHSTTTPPHSLHNTQQYKAYVGNGYLATVIGTDTMYAVGVFNGFNSSSTRARIPSTAAISVTNAWPTGSALDLESGTFLFQCCSASSSDF